MRVVRVLFQMPLPEPFDYEVPEAMACGPGDYVLAPLGKVERLGVVWEALQRPEDPERPLKPLARIFGAPPMPETMRRFIDRVAQYTVTPPGQVLAMALRSKAALLPSPTETHLVPAGETAGRLTDARQRVLDAAAVAEPMTAAALAREAGVSAAVVKGLVERGALRTERVRVDLPFDLPDPDRPGRALTGEQAAAAERLRSALTPCTFAPLLLDGVTGSGKTEVFFEAIAHVLRSDPAAQVLVLLPEIALTQAILARFTARFGAAPAAWHSGLSERARRRAWREVTHGRARIVIGARSALFLPFARLSLIIVDEEHDGSYKQEDGVSYHARDMAVLRARLENAGVILASATPALETAVNAEQGRYGKLTLRERPGTARLPDITLIDLRADPPERGHWLSPPLTEALVGNFAGGEQSLLFLNRRGYAPLVLCRACGERLKTPGTESWLTEHRYTGRLVCHLTGFSMKKPDTCPNCGAMDTLMGVGPGVERVAEEARRLLPQARIEIFSSDTAHTGEQTRGLVERMAAGGIDILIGTQIVAKGHNFPGLTLVGVVDADSGLKGGDLRAGERTFQLLSQVAGRAGRADRPGRALIQTYAPDNPAMIALAHGDRDGFLACERDMRSELGFPPFGRLAALIVSASSEAEVDEGAAAIARAAPRAEGVEVFGPAPAPIAILRGRHRRRFLVKSPRTLDLSAYMAAWRGRIRAKGSLRIAVDIDPYSFL